MNMSNPRQPSQAELAQESLYICNPTGFTAFRCSSEPTDQELSLMGLQRVVFKPVKLRPPVCPVNGAEGGDEPYWHRLPHRPNGTRLTFR